MNNFITVWITLADFFYKSLQFVFSVIAFAIAIYAAKSKWNDLFRTELTKKQFEELGKVRGELQKILFHLHCMDTIKETVQFKSWNLNDLKENEPELWDQYQQYKNTSLDLFYKFSDNDYYLFPDWIDKNKCQSFAVSMQKFAPFTLMAIMNKSESEREAYATEISKIKNYFDTSLLSAYSRKCNKNIHYN